MNNNEEQQYGKIQSRGRRSRHSDLPTGSFARISLMQEYDREELESVGATALAEYAAESGRWSYDEREISRRPLTRQERNAPFPLFTFGLHKDTISVEPGYRGRGIETPEDTNYVDVAFKSEGVLRHVLDNAAITSDISFDELYDITQQVADAYRGEIGEAEVTVSRFYAPSEAIEGDRSLDIEFA